MERLPKFIFTLLSMLLVAFGKDGNLCGQSPEPEPFFAHAWQIHSFYKDADLADKYVSMIDFTADGSAWLAVTDGLYFYDGYDWKKFTMEQGLPSNYVRAVLVTHDGTLWIGTENGAGIFRNGKFDHAGTKGNLAGPSVRRIVEDADGSIWFCCDQFPVSDISGGLTRLQKGEFKTWHSSDGLDSDYVSDYFRDSQGRQFVLSNRGLSQFNEGGFRQPLVDAQVWSSDTYVWSIVESPIHGLLVSTDAFFYQFKDDHWRSIPNLNPFMEQVKLGVCSDGEIYTMTSGAHPAIARWTGDGFEIVSERLPEVLGDVQLVVEEPVGALWFVGFERLLRWDRANPMWSSYPRLTGPLLKDKSEGIWFDSQDDCIWRLDNNQWTQFKGVQPPFYEDHHGRIWMKSGDQIAVWKGGSDVEHVSVPGMKKVTPIMIDEDDILWTYGVNMDDRFAIARCRGGNWHVDVLDYVDTQLTINYVSRDPHKGIWAVVSDKNRPPFHIFHVTEDSINPLDVPPQVTISNPPKILVQKNRGILLGGFFGLLAMDEKGSPCTEIKTVARAVDNLYQLGNDVWVSCMGHVGGTACLIRLPASGAPEVFPDLRGRIAGIDEHTRELYVSTNGKLQVLRTETSELLTRITTPFFDKASKVVSDSEGEYWFGVNSQTYHYVPSRSVPETRIESASQQLFEGDDFVVKIRGVESFTPRDLRREFQYSLKSDNTDWTPFKPLEGDVHVGDLGLGEHLIKVRVRDESGKIDSTPASLRVQVLPIPLQSKPWFAPTVLAVFLMFAVLATFATINWRRVRHLASGLRVEVAKQTNQLISSERKYRMLFEDSQDAICLFGTDGVLLTCNSAARKLLGVSIDNRDSISRLFSSSDEEQRFQRELKQNGSLLGIHFCVRGKNDRPFDGLLSANTWVDGVQRFFGYQVIIRDISDLVQLQKRLSETKKMEAIGRLAGGIAHDFNNFLAVMMYGADLIKLTSPKNPVIDQGVQMIFDAADRAKALTSKVQTFSHSRVVKASRINPRDVLLGMQNLLRGVVPANVKLNSHIDEGLRPIEADPQQLEQIVMNLVINACHAMPNGGTLTIQASNIMADKCGNSDSDTAPSSIQSVQIRVIDTGTGMTSETLEHVFDPFFTTKPQGQGVGLGLAIVYGIVQQFRGRINIHSQLGEGTSIEMEFPATEKSSEEKIEQPSMLQDVSGSENILLVEDEVDLRELTRKSLTRLGYSVTVAENGRIAMEIIEKGARIDLVISDVVMPGTSGFEIYEWLKLRRPQLPIMLISGYPQPNEYGKLNEFEMPFLQKPFRPIDLAARIRTILENKSRDRVAHETFAL